MDGSESSSPKWFVNTRPRIYRGWIAPTADPDSGCMEWSRQYDPLLESNLFLSFAGLAANGEPSESSALGWIEKYGLLRSNGISTREFQTASQEAYHALKLLEQLRSGDVAVLRSRIDFKDQRVLLDGKDIGIPQLREFNPQKSRWETVLSGDRRVRVLRHVDGIETYIYPEADDEAILLYSVRGLENIVTEKLENVRRMFGTGDDEHPRPLAEWRPQLVDHCPDLLTALWYQFAVMVAERRPMKRCVICGKPFEPRRSTKKTCGDACRQAKSRQNRRKS